MDALQTMASASYFVELDNLLCYRPNWTISRRAAAFHGRYSRCGRRPKPPFRFRETSVEKLTPAKIQKWISSDVLISFLAVRRAEC
jgi:hypothetical protein